MRTRTAAAAVLAAAVTIPATAGAHVSIHPNVLPQGANATLDVRVPNEMDNAKTTKLVLQMPDGVYDASFGYLPGWTVTKTTKKLPAPITLDDGSKVDSEIATVTFKGDGKLGAIPIGQFENFPMSIVVPGKPGQSLTFKALEYYSNGQVVRWIGPPSADQPAPTVNVTPKGGVLVDVAGGEAGPSAGQIGGPTTAPPGPTQPASTTTSNKAASRGLGITALILGALGVLVGGTALATRRRAAA